MSFSKLVVLTLAAVLGITTASLPPFETLGELRDKLSDADFAIDPADGGVISTANFTAETATAADFPLLGFSDVDVFVARVELFAGSSFFTHLHPRATEVLFVMRGPLQVSLQLEGLVAPRVVTNTLSAGQFTVFPQGLVQMIMCVGVDSSCEYVSFLNSADPGIVAV